MQKINFSQPSGAIISRCKQYRYALWRTWDATLPRVLFVCLNPSTADAREDDPTLRRCMDFAKQWGYGGMQTGNLFAYRSTDPAALQQVKSPVGGRNNQWLQYLAEHAELVVAAWGNDGNLYGRDVALQQLIPGLYCLRLNNSGQPAHPLYLKRTLRPFPMNAKTSLAIPVIHNLVAERFSSFPAAVRSKAESLRELIYKVAAEDTQIGPLEETLKWGQPSFLTTQSGSGTTIRVDWREKQPEDLVMFLNCRTTLVDTYRSIFPDLFSYEGTRAVVIGKSVKIERGDSREALAHCIRMALRYHLDK